MVVHQEPKSLLTVVHEFNNLLMLWTGTLLRTHVHPHVLVVVLVAVVVVLPGGRCVEHGLREATKRQQLNPIRLL